MAILLSSIPLLLLLLLLVLLAPDADVGCRSSVAHLALQTTTTGVRHRVSMHHVLTTEAFTTDVTLVLDLVVMGCAGVEACVRDA